MEQIVNLLIRDKYIGSLLSKMQTHDYCTYLHMLNCADIMEKALPYIFIGNQCSKEDLVLGALMHDIGKLALPVSVLQKPHPLTAKEKECMELHTYEGVRLMENAPATVRNICLLHHESPNGEGYPFGIKGEEIPDYCNIVHIVDIIEALSAKRPYKEAYNLEQICSCLADYAERGLVDRKYAEIFSNIIQNTPKDRRI